MALRRSKYHSAAFVAVRLALVPLIASLTAGCGSNPPASVASPALASAGSTAGDWTWMGGSSTVSTLHAGQAGVYGTLGLASAQNVPGGRGGAAAWKDASGNFWLLGGVGFDSQGNYGTLDDLWKYQPALQQWTWVAGDNIVGTSSCPSLSGQLGAYGTAGVASSTNHPGSRTGAVTWTDTGGNLWLFGGQGCPSDNSFSEAEGSYLLNDLWEFNPSTQMWTWIGGANTAGSPGVYGTQGTASGVNLPGARIGAVSWTDQSGNFWLFGGYGCDGDATLGVLSDLWEFSPKTQQWTWVSGSSFAGATPVYGTRGVASGSNLPPGRQNAVSWTDSKGNLWLFGGQPTSGNTMVLNDLWEFEPASQQWTWVSGSQTQNAGGVYGNEGTASTSNVPGARMGAVAWSTSDGRLWLFGGQGLDSTAGVMGELNDLWVFSPVAKTWTWTSGSDYNDAEGMYGTLGTAAAGDVPGARQGAVGWIDNNGNLWLFGSLLGYDATGANPNLQLNDLWMFQP